MSGTEDFYPSQASVAEDGEPALAIVFQRVSGFKPFALRVRGLKSLGRDDLARHLAEQRRVEHFDRTVSGAHLDLSMTNGGNLDVVCKSRNAVSINGWPVAAGEQARLAGGEILRLGNTVAVYRSDLPDPLAGDDAPIAASPAAAIVSPFALRSLRLELEALQGQPVHCALILGESGTGKELLARRVAEALGRRPDRFFPVNVAALRGQFLEAALMGSAKGAFTDAPDRAGIVEAAEGGTVFLDEIGDLGEGEQVSLLRLIENREVRRLGQSVAKPVDVLFVLATNRGLDPELDRFRHDLLARVQVTLRLPPLRTRSEDILEIAREMERRRGRDVDMAATEADAVELLLLARWQPGNTRDLDRVLLAHHRAASATQGLTLAGIGPSLGERPGRLAASPPARIEDLRRSTLCPAAIDAARKAQGGAKASLDAMYRWLADERRAVPRTFFSSGTFERWMKDPRQ